MRDYKFRGKRIDNGEWVYGNYQEGKGIHPHVIAWWTIQQSEGDVWDEIDVAEVDPETVGQYTGDKNRGYEGDILEWVESVRGEHGDVEDWEHCRGVVEWDNERSGFIVRCANGNEWLDALMNVTVIGNIYDNPELLGEGHRS